MNFQRSLLVIIFAAQLGDGVASAGMHPGRVELGHDLIVKASIIEWAHRAVVLSEMGRKGSGQQRADALATNEEQGTEGTEGTRGILVATRARAVFC